MRIRLAAASLLLTCWVLLPARSQPGDAPQGETVTVPAVVEGARLDMAIRFYRPQGPGPFPVVLFLHGRPTNREERMNLEDPVPLSHAQWWLQRGVAVIAPVRVGYGVTGGPDVEDTGARWLGSRCTGEPDFMGVAEAARSSAVVAYQWALGQPWVRRDRILVEGYSFGGLASMAVAASSLAGVRGAINFSGGTAGNPVDAPGHSCRPDLLERTYAELGRSARVPSLWLYARNDHYWGAAVPGRWHAAFRAGGSDSRLVMTAPLEGEDGHKLMADGMQLWSGPLDAFVRRIGFLY